MSRGRFFYLFCKPEPEKNWTLLAIKLVVGWSLQIWIGKKCTSRIHSTNYYTHFWGSLCMQVCRLFVRKKERKKKIESGQWGPSIFFKFLWVSEIDMIIKRLKYMHETGKLFFIVHVAKLKCHRILSSFFLPRFLDTHTLSLTHT